MSENTGGNERRTKVVTRAGDKGDTSLGKGLRVPKSSARVEAYGTVDEANSVIGVLRTSLLDNHELNEALRRIQIDLFDIGADLSMPGEIGESLRIGEEPMLRLEAELEPLNAVLPRLANFILPTGVRPAASYAHLARTVVRRAERRCVALSRMEDEAVNPEILRYLNRLADYMFILSRYLNDEGQHDDVWAPRGAR